MARPACPAFMGFPALYNEIRSTAQIIPKRSSPRRGARNIVSYVYSADSIKEFQVNNSNYNAELGQAAGGTVNAVTKSGATSAWRRIL